MQHRQQTGLVGTGIQQRGVRNGPDLTGIHGDGVAGIVATCDAIEAEPVAAKLEADDLLPTVGRLIDDLENSGVQDVEASESLTALMDHVAGMHHAPLRRERVVEHPERIGDMLRTVGIGSDVDGTAGGRSRGHGVLHLYLLSGSGRVGAEINARQWRTTPRQRCVSLGDVG